MHKESEQRALSAAIGFFHVFFLAWRNSKRRALSCIFNVAERWPLPVPPLCRISLTLKRARTRLLYLDDAWKFFFFSSLKTYVTSLKSTTLLLPLALSLYLRKKLFQKLHSLLISRSITRAMLKIHALSLVLSIHL